MGAGMGMTGSDMTVLTPVSRTLGEPMPDRVKDLPGGSKRTRLPLEPPGD